MFGASRYRVIYKKEGITPLAALELHRKTEPGLAKVPMTYAGRLDPMASGELLVLIGEECKRKDSYTNLDKEYEFEILLGAGTDTGDILGLPTLSPKMQFSQNDAGAAVRALIGAHELVYPAFSSKTVDGKPLFQHSLEGTIDDVQRPTKDIQIYRATFFGWKEIGAQELLSQIEKRINTLVVDAESKKIGADFRKAEILEAWRKLLHNEARTFYVLKCEATVSSGTYIRALADIIGKRLGTEALAYSIHRTKIGTFSRLFGKIGLWTRVF